MGTSLLDFLVIGAQRAGTTTLHALLRQHPDLCLPLEKEAPFFTVPQLWPLGLDGFVKRYFPASGPDVVRGKVTPQYMMGAVAVPTHEVAERVAQELPRVKIVAVLRDPVTRAHSQWQLSVRRGLERRSFEESVRELLTAKMLTKGRERPTETNSYVAQGEYGRILTAWRERFAAEQIHVEYTDDLQSCPQKVLERVQQFVGVTPMPAMQEGRLNAGGTTARLDQVACAELRAVVHEHVLPDATAMRAFDYWLEGWNVNKESADAPLPATRQVLHEHFLHDADLLHALGYSAPWREVPPESKSPMDRSDDHTDPAFRQRGSSFVRRVLGRGPRW